ncbi:MAG: ATP-binding protein [Acidiferrobacterales bacterium]|nr:ATP-binding protein [Acidiferrobacterales bacterium]
MIDRAIASRLVRLFEQYPFVTVTGPRQSGKTTLCRAVFPHLRYVNLESPDVREFAQSDPRGFLSEIDDGAIIDEVQRVPELLSYLQVLSDDKGRSSLFVLTGSEHFKLSNTISQSLAGRTGLLYLLPLTIAERDSTGAGQSIEDILYSGFYPRIYDQQLDANQAYSDYFETYVERDILRIGQIRNRQEFRRFVRLCAGRIGQIANLSTIGADAGISHTTAQQWLNLLETSFIAFRLPPFRANLRKRLVKSPKIYFYDVGLAAYLIGINQPEQISTHPMRGALFENMVVVETMKYCFNNGKREILSFFRDSRGLECDLLFETGDEIFAIEIKSGATIATDYFKPFDRIGDLIPKISRKIIVYGGSARQTQSSVEVVPFGDLSDVLDRFQAEKEMSSIARTGLSDLPDSSDRGTLDAVFYAYIRPTLDHLEQLLSEHVKPLFQRYHAGSKLSVRDRTINSATLFEPSRWESIKEQEFAFVGFRIEKLQPLIFVHSLELKNLVTNLNLNLTVSLKWTFDTEALTLTIDVDGNQCTGLSGLRWPHSQIGIQSAKIDFICSTVLKSIKLAIQQNALSDSDSRK